MSTRMLRELFSDLEGLSVAGCHEEAVVTQLPGPSLSHTRKNRRQLGVRRPAGGRCGASTHLLPPCPDLHRRVFLSATKALTQADGREG